jgi:hypothetical protein
MTRTCTTVFLEAFSASIVRALVGHLERKVRVTARGAGIQAINPSVLRADLVTFLRRALLRTALRRVRELPPLARESIAALGGYSAFRCIAPYRCASRSILSAQYQRSSSASKRSAFTPGACESKCSLNHVISRTQRRYYPPSRQHRALSPQPSAQTMPAL